MPRCLYNSTIPAFIDTDADSLLGKLGINYHGDILTTTNEAWASEIDIMQDVLQPWKDEPGQIIFEYDIPRLGKRIDVVLLLRGIIGSRLRIGSEELSPAEPEPNHSTDSYSDEVSEHFQRISAFCVR